MNKKNMITNIVLGLLLGTGLYANEPCKDMVQCEVNSIVYIEDEAEFELGFDTADYLPEDFNPHRFYFDLNSVEFIEDVELNFDSKQNLPKDFNAYAQPKDFRDISYIDSEDNFEYKQEEHIYRHGQIDAHISK